MTSAFYIALATTLFCALAALCCLGLGGNSRSANQRMLQVTRAQSTFKRKSRKHAEQRFLRIFRGLRAHVGLSETPKLRERFAAAGLKNSDRIELYFAARMLGPVTGLLIGSFIPTNTFLWIVAMAGVAYMAPDFWLDRKGKKRREKIRKSIPDSIDLLVICVDAGLGLDQAMLRVGQELVVSHPEINEEFLQINREQRAGKARLDAWKSFSERTKLADVQSFVNMLIQTERFGTPIARALSNYADGLRQKRRQVAEEKAAKTTVKMIFPLVLFIFPTMFIVLLGPAIISISKGIFTGGQ